MTRYFSKVEIAVLRVNTDPIETKLNRNFNHGSGPERNPQAESWLTAAQFLLQSLTCGLLLVHRILLEIDILVLVLGPVPSATTRSRAGLLVIHSGEAWRPPKVARFDSSIRAARRGRVKKAGSL